LRTALGMGTKLLLTKWESTDENKKKNNGTTNHNANATVVSHNSTTDRATIVAFAGKIPYC
jgi:hypothetical protein